MVVSTGRLESGDHRDLHYPLRRQRQMCIRDSKKGGVFFFGHHDALLGKPTHEEKGREEERDTRGWLVDGDGGTTRTTVCSLEAETKFDWLEERESDRG